MQSNTTKSFSNRHIQTKYDSNHSQQLTKYYKYKVKTVTIINKRGKGLHN